MLFNQARFSVKVYKMSYLHVYVKPQVTLAFFIDGQVVECLYSQLPSQNLRSYSIDGVVSVYSFEQKYIWQKHFDISIRYEIEPNMLDLFDSVSRLMDHSTAMYPESTLAGKLAVMDFGDYVKAFYIYTQLSI